MVYHGTFSDFNEFKKEFQSEHVHYEQGFFFTENKEQAKLYGDRVIPVYLKAETDFRDARKNRKTKGPSSYKR